LKNKHKYLKNCHSVNARSVEWANCAARDRWWVGKGCTTNTRDNVDGRVYTTNTRDNVDRWVYLIWGRLGNLAHYHLQTKHAVSYTCNNNDHLNTNTYTYVYTYTYEFAESKLPVLSTCYNYYINNYTSCNQTNANLYGLQENIKL